MNKGLYFGMSRKDYEAIPAINQSLLKKWGELGLGKCPAAFHYSIKNGGKDNDTLKLGRAIDIYLIEGPIAFSQKVAVFDGVRNPKSAEWKAFQLANQGKDIVKPSEMTSIKGMAESLMKADRTEGAVFLNGVYSNFRKAVFVSELCGVLVKGEIDLCNEDEERVILDQKKTASVAKDDFAKQIINFGYDIQAAFYSDALHALDRNVENYAWRIVEEDAPYLAAEYWVHYDGMEIGRGRNRYEYLMRSYLDQLSTGDWPEMGSSQIELPHWAYKNEQFLSA